MEDSLEEEGLLFEEKAKGLTLVANTADSVAAADAGNGNGGGIVVVVVDTNDAVVALVVVECC